MKSSVAFSPPFLYVAVYMSVLLNFRTEYTLEELKQKPPPEGVDPSRVEAYLNADDFQVKSSTIFLLFISTFLQGSAVASWLARSTPGRAVWVRVLGLDIVLCSWARHFTLTVPLFTQVYKWVPANLMLRVTLRWTTMLSRGEYKYFWSLHVTEIGISPGLMSHVTRMQTLPYLPYSYIQALCSFVRLLRSFVAFVL